MIGDDEIKELRRWKSSLQEAQLRALGVAIDNFKTSARYDLVKTLSLDQFIKGPASGLKPLASKTLEELVDSGVVKICKSGKLTTSGVKRLAEIFFKLQGDPAVTAPPVKAKVFSLPHLRAVGDKAKPIASQSIAMGSVEAEEKLETAIRKLRLSPRFEDLADNRLGDYWDRTLVSAPFEESLTFRQFSEMKVRALLEKRSFGIPKIQGILAAVERALSQPIPEAETAPSAGNSLPPRPEVSERDVLAPAALLWQASDVKVPRHAVMLLRLYEYQVGRATMSIGPLAKLLREIPKKLLPLEFLAAWFLQEFHEDLVAQLLSIDRNEVLTRSDIAYKKLDKLVSAVASELRSYWEIALRGPGIGSEKLIEIFREPLLDEEFQIGICQVLLSSTGARHPIVFGEDLSSYWSKSPSALQMTITAVIAALPKSDEDLQAEVEALFPFFEKSVILSILHRQAFFRERDKTWVRRGDDIA
ncbi:MAG: hypothetical protein J0M12_03245 [Deltaproteobacteria bacterium]|nr:hypothetical protein [Deltaproteobacteria bacterium]